MRISMKDIRTGAMSAPVAPLFAQSIPVSPIVGLNTLNWPASAGFGSTAPGWYKEVGLVDPDVVRLQGAVKQTSAGGPDANLIGTLPPAASPNRVVYAIVHTFNGTYADVAINPKGEIALIDPKPPAVSSSKPSGTAASKLTLLLMAFSTGSFLAPIKPITRGHE